MAVYKVKLVGLNAERKRARRPWMNTYILGSARNAGVASPCDRKAWSVLYFVPGRWRAVRRIRATATFLMRSNRTRTDQRLQN
ncbi:hypothetical protein NL676_031237 [Syzygium grande]|nr:hypothetical protein NL676_031237 [Syzygium grande]